MTQRVPIPKKARRRSAVPFQYSVSRELTVEEMQVLAQRYLSGTEYHKLISGDVYPGITLFTGVYWGTQGKAKDLGKVADRWELVEAEHPDLTPDGTLEYLVTAALQDEVEVDVVDLTQRAG